MVPGKGATKRGSVGTGFGECKGFVTLFCGVQFCLSLTMSQKTKSKFFDYESKN